MLVDGQERDPADPAIHKAAVRRMVVIFSELQGAPFGGTNGFRNIRKACRQCGGWQCDRDARRYCYQIACACRALT